VKTHHSTLLADTGLTQIQLDRLGIVPVERGDPAVRRDVYCSWGGATWGPFKQPIGVPPIPPWEGPASDLWLLLKSSNGQGDPLCSGTKRCTKCQRVLHVLCFPARQRSVDGLQPWCRECHREADRTRRKAR